MLAKAVKIRDTIRAKIGSLVNKKMTKYISREGYEKLRKELERLKGPKRRELSKAIGIARGHGDISENAEYDAAKDAQGLNEKKISELETKLASSEILDESQMSADKVLLGATVELKDADSGEKLKYKLVSELEADFAEGKISVTSPIGKGLIGHKKGETVEINVPAGVIKYKVIKISR